MGIDLQELLDSQHSAGERDVPVHYEVWPEHWNALRLYLACRGQFELEVGMAGVVYRPARSVNVDLESRWLGLDEPATQRDAIQQYRVIEAEALRLANEAN